MWRSKKFILIAVLATLVLVGSIGGIVYTQTASANEGSGKTLLAKVAAILGIDQQKLEDAFNQARSEMKDEALQKLVDEGKITQEQIDQYKAWLQSKPDLEQYRQQLRDWQQTRPGIPPELKQWQEARPDIPLPGHFGGDGGMRWGGGCFFGGK